jgi:hypothetical protein
MRKRYLSSKHLLISGILTVASFLLLPLNSLAATVAYSTNFSQDVNLVVHETKSAVRLSTLQTEKHKLPYGQGIEAEIPAVYTKKAIINTTYTEDSRFPTGLWLLGSALIAMVGYKRMRSPNE